MYHVNYEVNFERTSKLFILGKYTGRTIKVNIHLSHNFDNLFILCCTTIKLAWYKLDKRVEILHSNNRIIIYKRYRFELLVSGADRAAFRRSYVHFFQHFLKHLWLVPFSNLTHLFWFWVKLFIIRVFISIINVIELTFDVNMFRKNLLCLWEQMLINKRCSINGMRWII